MTETQHSTYCANHPTVETTLRCNRCDKPICPKCAVKSPVGYRCRECVKSQQKIFDTADLVRLCARLHRCRVSLESWPASLIGLIGFIGFFGWIILVVCRAHRRRGIIAEARAPGNPAGTASQSLYYTILAAVALGALPVILLRT